MYSNLNSSKVAGSVVALLLAYLSWAISKSFNVAFQQDLRRIPGPVLSRFTGIPLKIAVLTGRRSVYIHALHERYGPYVRIAPEEVHTADFEAFRIIHRVGSPWNKGSLYQGQVPSQTTDETSAVFFIRNNKTASPRRRLFQSAGTKKTVVEWEPQIQELVDLAVQKMARELSENGASDVLKWWHLMTSDITGSLAFGKSFQNTENGKKNQLIHDAEMLMPILGLRGELPFTSYIMDFLPAWCPGSANPLWNRYKAYGEEAVRATRLAQQGNSKTLFSKMVSDEESDQAIPDSLIAKEAANVIIAGTDTTAMTLTYLVYLVARHPDVQQKLVNELQSCTANPNWQELEEKRYLNSVIEEAMRLYPVIPGSMTRVVPLGGESALRYKIPAGTQVGTQPWTFQRDPTVFEDPLQQVTSIAHLYVWSILIHHRRFNPDRWLNATPAMNEHMMAFGGPSRICIGQNIARLTLLHATSKLFRECPDIKLSHETTDESMTPVDYFAIRPKGEKCVVVLG